MNTEELIDWLVERYINAEEAHSPWCDCDDCCSCADVASARTDASCDAYADVAEHLGVSFPEFRKKVKEKRAKG